jgi:hypothetical protein
MTEWLRIFAFVSLVVAALPAQSQTSNKPQSKTRALGTLANGVYHQNLTGIEVTLPADWVVVNQAPASEPGAQFIKLKNSVSNAIATVWLKRGRLDDKVMQRNNFQHLTIGERPALSAVADYLNTERKMVEHLTWIDGEKSRVLFGGRIPASN